MSEDKKLVLTDVARAAKLESAKAFSYRPKNMIAFADEELMELFPPSANEMAPAEEAPEVPMEEEMAVEEEVKSDMEMLKEKLQALIDDEEVERSVAKEAEEHVARLEELQQAQENAQKFVDDNTPEVEEVVVEEEMPAEEAPEM